MPAISKYKEFQKSRTTEELFNSALEHIKEEKHASAFTILRNNVYLKEHTSLTGINCIGSNGTQIGTEIDFVINNQHEKTLIYNHCYKPGLSEQK